MPIAVYPRVCGATQTEYRLDSIAVGLSPRVRGNLWHSFWIPRHTRSIPACAGQPRICQARALLGTVYPRVCGATSNGDFQKIAVDGLSPRVRGNPLSGGRCRARSGSIPACAGQPRLSGSNITEKSVYPRVCGATPCSSILGIAFRDVGRTPSQWYFTKYTPSLSTISLGASPRVRIRCSPTASGSRQVITIEPWPSS